LAVFIDTNVFVALRNADDELHTRSKELIEKASKGKFGRIFPSDYVIDEAVTTALVRTRRHDLAIDIGKYIIESPRITKLWTKKENFDTAWQKFKTFKDKPLSFSDCVSLALMEKNRIKQIMSFNSDFNGLAHRIY